ncbi:MAG: hydrolase [Phycisphaerales bacterium]|nr:hydrolase [Phycisphaerales bacterium]
MPHHETPTPALTNAQLLVVDVQERLLPHIHNASQVIEQTSRMLRAARELSLPIIVSEQYVRGLGPTEPGLRESAGGATFVEKMTFSVWRDDAARDALGAAGRPIVIIAGIETHVCVQQTALDLVAAGYGAVLLADAVGSRRKLDHDIALVRMRAYGVDVTTTESMIYTLMERAGTERFKRILPIVK